jgi:hypothetical protein
MGVPASARMAVIGALLGLSSLASSCQPIQLMVADKPAMPDSTRPGDDESGGGSGAAGGNAGAGGEGQPTINLPDAALVAEDGGGPGARCAGESHAAKLVPVDLFMLLDVSGSMLSLVGGTATKWDLVRSALLTFIADPKSAGLGVGLQLFPLPAPCKQNSDCSPFPLGEVSCRDHGICTAPGMSLASTTACDSFSDRCPAGTTCTPVLRCSKSQLPCRDKGQICPGGAADDRCDDPALRCLPALADGCEAALYAQPALPVGELPGWATHLGLTIASVNPGGSTPMAPAVAGTLSLLRVHATTHPGRKPILVLATDGFPTGCGPNTIETVAAAILGGRMGLPSMPTYVIGVFAQTELVRSQLALSQLAVAGGTGAPFVLEEGKDLAQKFLAALEQIRGSALACDFAIPRPVNGTLDFGKVNVRFTPGGAGAVPEDLVYVGAADRCDPTHGGWFYDVDPKAGGVPTRIQICEASCKRFRAESAGQVDLQVGCTSRVD